MVNRTRLGQLLVVLALAALMLAGCGTQQVIYVVASPTPTPVVITVVVTSTPAPPTPTLTPVPATPTATSLPVTPTPTPLPATLTPTPLPAPPTPKTFVITDKAFSPEDCQSNTVLEINDVKGESFSITVKQGNLAIRGGRMTIWCRGIEHIWIGKLSYASHTFDSTADDPLRFLLVEGGYQYVGGAGTVTLPDGTRVTLP